MHASLNNQIAEFVPGGDRPLTRLRSALTEPLSQPLDAPAQHCGDPVFDSLVPSAKPSLVALSLSLLRMIDGFLAGRYHDDQNSGPIRRERFEMAKTLSLSEVKTRLPELIVGVQDREEEVVVTKNGRPAAILINVQEYARLKETLDVLSDPALMKQISRSRAFYRSGRKGLTFEDVFGEPVAGVKKRRSA